MLDAPEETVCLVERQYVIRRKELQLMQCSQCLEHACFLQKRMARSMNKLQRLHNEFDIANAPASEFHIALEVFCANDVPLDPVLDAGDLLQQIWCRALRIHERLMLP